MVLEHCKRKDKKNECKNHFPRTTWLIDKAVVLCKGLLQRMGMPHQGRKNMIGALHGPMNEANLNGTHPAMLAAQQCNSDVQLPYRLPITPETHSSLCTEADTCTAAFDDMDVVRSCQVAQNTQAGYMCDYCCKRLPCGCNEVREACGGLKRLGQQVENEPTKYAGKRFMGRILCHAYQNGVVKCCRNSESASQRACS